MSLFQLGFCILAAGKISKYKIDCDFLTDSDLDCLAWMLTERLPHFGSVEGVPQGGLRLAKAMKVYITEGPLLIVDDVWTTGGSINKFAAGREHLTAVIFARNKPPEDITALFVLQG